MDKPMIVCQAEKDVTYTLYESKWIPNSAKLVTMGSTHTGCGALSIYQVTGGDLELLDEHLFDVCQPAFKCGTFGASDENKLAMGDFKGNVHMWSLENVKKPIFEVKTAHLDIINSIDGFGGKEGDCGAPELVTGSSDGCVKLWDLRIETPVMVMQSINGKRRDCWAVAFGNGYSAGERVISAGFENGDLKTFDLKMKAVLWETSLDNGICSLEFDRKDTEMNRLLVTMLESCVQVFELRNKYNNFPCNIGAKAHKSTVWCGKHLPQNPDFFATTGGSGTFCLWKYIYGEPCKGKRGPRGTLKPVQRETISTQGICNFDWCPTKTGLATCVSFDQKVRMLIVTKLG